MAAPTYFGSAAVPADGASAINATTTLTITPPGSMQAGDLVVVSCQSRAATTWSVGVTGGQTWYSETVYSGANFACRTFWCRYNGTWGASPRFDSTSGTCTTAVMHVFRPDNTTKQWIVDVPWNDVAYAAPSSPFTVTRAGVVTSFPDTVTLAHFHSVDDNTWGSISGSGWVVTGSAQYRNTASTDQSAAYAHHLDATPATIPSVSLNQTTLGGDNGATAIIAWAAVAAGDITTNCIGRWQFEDNDNDSAGTNHGTATGSPTYVTGKVGAKARAFSGAANQYVELKSGTHIITGDDWTMCCWINPQSLPGSYQIIVGHGDQVLSGGYSGFQFGINNSNQLWCEVIVGTDTPSEVVGTATLATGTWYFVAITKNGQELDLYVNGVLDTFQTLPSSSMDYTADNIKVRAGGDNAGSPCNVYLDELRFYSVPLSASAIGILYTFFTTGGAALTKSLSDTLAFTELPTKSAAYLRNRIEPLTITELLGKIAAYLRSLADPAFTIGENVVPVKPGAALSKNLSDNIALTELLSQIATLKRSLVDPLTIIEAFAKSMTFGKALSDSLTATESIGAVRALIRSYFDPLNVGEAAVGLKLLIKAVSDSLTLAEALDKQILLAAYSDDFNRANSSTVGASWNENVSGVDIASNKVQFVNTGAYASAVWTQGVPVSAQYQKATVSWVAGKLQSFGFLFRCSNTSNGSCYQIIFDNNSDQVGWNNVSNMTNPSSSTSIGTGTLAVSPGDTIGITLELTGNNTVVRIWLNPTGLPARANDWNGDTTPNVTLTQNPATPRDAGTFLGLIGAPLEAASTLTYDNWFGGGCLESTGVFWTKDLFDNLIVTEVLGKVADLQRYVSDPITITDLIGKAAALQRAVSDPLPITEATVAKSRGLARSYSDTLTIGEALAKTAGKKFTDALTITEAFAKQLSASKALSDPLTITEALSKQPQLKRTDTLTITDPFAKQMQFGRSLSDLITITDLVTRFVGAKSLSDTIALSEAIKKQINRPLSELLTLGEALRKDAGKNLADTLTITEALVKFVGKKITDPITITELVGRLKQISKSVSDSITLTEALSTIFVGIKSVSDTITLGETVSKQLQRRLTDTLNILGSLENAAQLKRSCIDPITITELVGKLRDLRRSTSDTIAITEAIGKIIVLARGVSDIITITESLKKTFGRSRSDSLTITEAIGKSIGFAKALPDSMTLLEALASSATFRKSVTDLITLTDTGTRKVLRQLLADTFTISEFVVALKITNLFKTVSDPITITDFVAKQFILLRQLSDILTITEAAVAKVSAFHRLRSDPLTLTEALGKSVIFGRPITDTIRLEDLLGRMASYRRSTSDIFDLLERLEAARLLKESKSDSITLSDVVDTTMVIGTLSNDRGQHRLIHGRIFSRVN